MSNRRTGALASANESVSGEAQASEAAKPAAATQFKASVGSLAYDDQVEAVKPPMPLQFNLAGQAGGAGAVHQTAAEGVSGSGSQLPHLDTIQQSFGGHDVSSVSSHVGGAAAKATKSLGAEAYATGNSVAFKSSPSLHTAAHEAAHVVQQRSGVSLDGGVGKVGDSYERNADAVADRVVSGQSAADLLPGGSGGGAGVQRKAVQLTTPTSDTTGSDSGSSETPEQLLAKLPRITYKQAGGTGDQAVTFKLVGENGQLVEGTRPLIGAADSVNPIQMARAIEALATEYVRGARKGDAALLTEIKTKMEQLQKEMSRARGEDIAMVKLRTDFEKLIGAKAFGGGPGGFANANSAIAGMCSSAVNMVLATAGIEVPAATAIGDVLEDHKDNAELNAALAATGVPLTAGFGGAVGTELDKIKQVFIDGTLTQKAVHLINFGDKFVAPKLVGKNESVLATAKANMKSAEYHKMIDRADSAKGKKKPHKILFTEADKTRYIEAKHGNGEMDTKAPYVPIENLTDDELMWMAGAKGVDVSGCENRAAIISAMKTAGYSVSTADANLGDKAWGGKPTSLAIDQVTVEGKRYLEGIRDNIVDPAHNWIFTATNVLQMPLKAGISGTTHRFVSLAQVMGVACSDARLAMLGHLQNIEAHSFHEICVAAAGFGGCDYVDGKYVPFTPVSNDDMEAAAIESLAADSEFAAAVTGENDRKLQAKRLLNA